MFAPATGISVNNSKLFTISAPKEFVSTTFISFLLYNAIVICLLPSGTLIKKPLPLTYLPVTLSVGVLCARLLITSLTGSNSSFVAPWKSFLYPFMCSDVCVIVPASNEKNPSFPSFVSALTPAVCSTVAVK
nr:MAG TPA: hypothetical protein [Caudoviricetes sp.]